MTKEVNAASLHGGWTVKQVKKQLADLKSKTWKKTAAIRKYRKGTGDGSPCKITLSAIEELMLTTINPQTIDGIIEDGDS